METTTDITTKLFNGIPVIEFTTTPFERGIMEELQEAASDAWTSAGYQSDEHQEKLMEAWDYEFSLICKSMDRQFRKINQLDCVKISDNAWNAFSLWAKEMDINYKIIAVKAGTTRIIITQI